MIVRMRWALCGCVLLVGAGWAAAPPDDLPREVLLLAHFTRQMREVLSQVPNYTCLETIQRSVQEPGGKVFSPVDTVLLEVSNVGNKELRALPGAERFEERDLASFASSGLMGSGAFASYARTIFLSDNSSIQYHGEEEMAGRPVARFDFSIPVIWSGYQLRANGVTGSAGLAGSFWIEATSLELVRLAVRGYEIPAELGIERTTTVIDYARMRVGESDVLLPQDAAMTLVVAGGVTHRNDIEFSHCHEYQTASSIRFDMAEASAPRTAPAGRKVDLPAGLAVSMELETAIDSANVKVGDVLRGHVTEDVRRKGGAAIIPAGASVTGRIRRLERSHSAEPAWDVTIEIAEVAWEDTRAEFYGELLTKNSGRPGMGSWGSTTGEIHAVRIPGTGVLHMTGAQFQIARGFRMNWRTVEPNQRLKKSP